MVDLKMEYIIILVIVVFMLYHLSSCRCFDNGFRVGGSWCKKNMECLKTGDCSNINLSYCDLKGNNLPYRLFKNAELKGVHLDKAFLSHADLTGADLKGANLTKAYLAFAGLKSAILEDANLTGANLMGAHLDEAFLRSAILKGADLTGATLTDAYFTFANLTDANIRGADFKGANLTGTYGLNSVKNAKNAKCSHNTTFPSESIYECNNGRTWNVKSTANFA